MSSYAHYAYLLRFLAAGIIQGDVQRVMSPAMASISRTLGIEIWACPVFEKGRRRKLATPRLFFTARDRMRNDDFADRFAEAVLLSAELAYGPLFEMRHRHLGLPFRSSRFRRNQGIAGETLKEAISAATLDWDPEERDDLLYPLITIPDEVVSYSLTATPVLLDNPKLGLAAAFLSQAQEDFHVFPGQLCEAVYNGDWVPTRLRELARWESGYQNCYKAIEAVIGDPVKDDRRFEASLRAAGVDPYEQVGYERRQSIKEVIREMTRIRDTRAAHGSTPNRGIKMYQMVGFQECARYVVQTHIESRRQTASITLDG